MDKRSAAGAFLALVLDEGLLEEAMAKLSGGKLD